MLKPIEIESEMIEFPPMPNLIPLPPGSGKAKNPAKLKRLPPKYYSIHRGGETHSIPTVNQLLHHELALRTPQIRSGSEITPFEEIGSEEFDKKLAFDRTTTTLLALQFGQPEHSLAVAYHVNRHPLSRYQLAWATWVGQNDGVEVTLADLLDYEGKQIDPYLRVVVPAKDLPRYTEALNKVSEHLTEQEQQQHWNHYPVPDIKVTTLYKGYPLISSKYSFWRELEEARKQKEKSRGLLPEFAQKLLEKLLGAI